MNTLAYWQNRIEASNWKNVTIILNKKIIVGQPCTSCQISCPESRDGHIKEPTFLGQWGSKAYVPSLWNDFYLQTNNELHENHLPLTCQSQYILAFSGGNARSSFTWKPLMLTWFILKMLTYLLGCTLTHTIDGQCHFLFMQVFLFLKDNKESLAVATRKEYIKIENLIIKASTAAVIMLV